MIFNGEEVLITDEIRMSLNDQKDLSPKNMVEDIKQKRQRIYQILNN